MPISPEHQTPTTALATLLDELRAEIWAQQQRREAESAEPVEREAVPALAYPAIAHVSQQYQLPPEYQVLLQAIGKQPVVIFPGPYQELVLYTAKELPQAQVGFRGRKLGEESFVAPNGWRRSWVVIAADNGDPYFIDTAKTLPNGDCPVWTAMHGTGTWEPFLAASSLGQFLQILRVWVRVMVPHYDPQNPDEPLDDAQLRRMNSDIRQIDSAAASQWAQ